MKMLARAAFALLALFAAPVAAQNNGYVQNVGPASTMPSISLGFGTPGSFYTPIDATHGLPVNCILGCGGGGGGSNAAAVAVGANAGAYASQTGYVGSDGKIYSQVGDLAGHPLVSIFGTVALTSSGTIGTPAPTSAVQVGGTGPNGNLRALGTDTGGRLLPGQGIAYAGDGASTPAPVTLTASTAMQLAAAVSNRIGFRVQLEQALSAPIYLCSRVTTTCSATSHDGYIPGSATDGSIWNYDFPPNSAIYYYTTGTPKVLPVNVVAQ